VVSFTPRSLYPGERAPGTHWIGGWVDPRASLDDVKERKFLTLPGLELWLLCRWARSQSLHRLRQHGSLLSIIHFRKFHRQHQCTLQLVWRHGVLLVSSWRFFMRAITSIALFRKSFGVGHMYMYPFFFFFAYNDRHCDLPECWTLLLGHPVHKRQRRISDVECWKHWTGEKKIVHDSQLKDSSLLGCDVV
jgi:hypothetical protein